MDGIDIYSQWMIIIFVLGYILIAFEHLIDINKATSALMMGVLCWALQFANQHVLGSAGNLSHLCEHLSNVSQVVIFLLGAMIIVEIISAHKGFKVITNHIRVRSKRKLLWIMGILAFFLSAILDNLTTTIVLVSITQKMVTDRKDRLLFGGAVVIAANAGGLGLLLGMSQPPCSGLEVKFQLLR